jgi:hypothetical protein
VSFDVVPLDANSVQGMVRWKRRTKDRKLVQRLRERCTEWLQRNVVGPGGEMSMNPRSDSISVSLRHERVDHLITSSVASSALEKPKSRRLFA